MLSSVKNIPITDALGSLSSQDPVLLPLKKVSLDCASKIGGTTVTCSLRAGGYVTPQPPISWLKILKVRFEKRRKNVRKKLAFLGALLLLRSQICCSRC